MKKRKHLFLIPLLLSLMLVGCSDSFNGKNYVVILDENDYCEVYKIEQTYSPVLYAEGWKFTQHSNSHFTLEKDEVKKIYSNSRYGYFISIS